MSKDVAEYCSACLVCQLRQSKMPKTTAQTGLHPACYWCSKPSICSMGHGPGESFVRCMCLFSCGSHRIYNIMGRGVQ